MDDLKSIEERILSSIRRIIRAIDLHSRHIFEEFGLTIPQLAVLKEAARLGKVTSGALARAANLSQPTVTGILNRLEKRGLIKRVRGELDRRTVVIEITDSCREILRSAPSLLQERFQTQLASLESWEQLQIYSTLQRVASMMGAGELEAAPHLITDSMNLKEGEVTGSSVKDNSPSAKGTKP